MKIEKLFKKYKENYHCGDCNYWRPTRRSKIGYIWGVCLASHGLNHKWTSPCTVFTTDENHVVKDDIVYLKKYRFVNS
ncbi:MAG: hypothetical protein SRB2_02139 [Desulfobacteraceae bacterium Eth-SRB2]|nr:MAG: hypothetical protein SRB2_02139 [Desulfobacteraceae bacterium Eth-SRB2]